MQSVTVRVKIGGFIMDSADDPRTELLDLETRRSLGGSEDRCCLVLYAPPAATDGLEAAAGATVGTAAAAASAFGLGGGASGGTALSTSVRGTDLKAGDPIEVELRVGEVSATVMTAEVQEFRTSLRMTTILGWTGIQQLGGARLNQVYQNQSTGQVVRDLAAQVGVDVGDIDNGGSWPYLVVDESRSVLRHLRQLAMREGADLYFDERNHLTVKRLTKSGPDHRFRYGVDLLDLRLRRGRSGIDRVQVFGESPSSDQGLTTWPWLVTDLAPLGGSAGQGSRYTSWRDGAVRTKDAADGLAAARLGAASDAATEGLAVLLGNPRVQPGEAIEISEAPWSELNGLFKVVSVRHRLGKRPGFVTVVGFSGLAGTGSARPGGVAGAGGQLAGGFGL
jgi:hypothetical protein